MNGLVAPRPIAWVSTIGADGDPEPRAVLVLQRLLVPPLPDGRRRAGRPCRHRQGHARELPGDRRAGDLGGHRGAGRARERDQREFGPRRRRAGGEPGEAARVAELRRLGRSADRRPRQRRGPSNALVIARVVHLRATRVDRLFGLPVVGRAVDDVAPPSSSTDPQAKAGRPSRLGAVSLARREANARSPRRSQ